MSQKGKVNFLFNIFGLILFARYGGRHGPEKSDREGVAQERYAAQNIRQVIFLEKKKFISYIYRFS